MLCRAGQCSEGAFPARPPRSSVGCPVGLRLVDVDVFAECMLFYLVLLQLHSCVRLT